MSERRPHWDDDLIEAVNDCLDTSGDVISFDAYGVIAAVEDWHKAKRDSRIRTHSEGCWRWHNECAEALIVSQQAAIQRVRELHKGSPECAYCAGVTGLPDGANVDTCDECCEVMPCPTIRALDGTDD